VFSLQLGQLKYVSEQLAALSEARTRMVMGQEVKAEEHKGGAGAGADIIETFQSLSSNVLYTAYLCESYQLFLLNRSKEANLKALAAAAATEGA